MNTSTVRSRAARVSSSFDGRHQHQERGAGLDAVQRPIRGDDAGRGDGRDRDAQASAAATARRACRPPSARRTDGQQQQRDPGGHRRHVRRNARRRARPGPSRVRGSVPRRAHACRAPRCRPEQRQRGQAVFAMCGTHVRLDHAARAAAARTPRHARAHRAPSGRAVRDALRRRVPAGCPSRTRA